MLLCAACAHAQSTPAINSLTSTQGGVGQWLEIQGSNFGSSQGASTVKFNGVAATALQWASGYVNVNVPSGATTGPVVVTVAGVASNGVTFTVITTPYIASINPPSGGVGQGVSLYGSNFGSSQGSSTVTFNGVAATVSGWTNTNVNVAVPTGATTGNIVVTVGGVISNAVSFTVNLTPAINSLTSTQGGVGQWVEIQGSNFGSSQGASTVKFNGVAATALQWASGYINVNVPSGATTGPVVVTVAGVASNGVTFTVITTPYIASINPPSGGVGQGVSLYGSNFGSSQGSSTVTFNGVAATVSGWTNTNVNVAVPTGATTGNIVVTVGGVASNGFPFIVNQAPVITSANSVIFATGYPGSFTVTATGSPAPVLSESGALPSGVTFVAGTRVLSGTSASGTAGSYPITFTASNGISPNATQNFTLTVAIPPAITSSVSPTPNSNGWVNINATVTFTCTAGTYPISSCPGPQTVSTDGAGQIVSGTVTDTHGLTASTSVTINLDKTIPTLTVTSPVDQTSESSSPVTVSGTLTDALSGASGVTCDGVTATLSGGSFSCNISLNVGVNLVVVRGTDIAGNVAGDNFHVSLTGALPAPTSLQVTPTGVNMVVGGTQQFTVVDQQGHPRSDASWSVDNTSIATIDTNTSPTLTAVATGTATLTASVGSATAQTQVNILSGTSLPVGTVLWSAPTPSGYSVLQTLQAVPTIGSPDLYSVQRDAVSKTALVSAFTADGRMLWSTAPFPEPFTAIPAQGVPDGNGGILVDTYQGLQGDGDRKLVDLDGQTGAQVWQYSSTTARTRGSAVAGNGNIYLADSEFYNNPQSAALVTLDGTTGAILSEYVPPSSTVTVDATPCNGRPPYTTNGASTIFNPVVGPDGTVYAAVGVIAETDTYNSGCGYQTAIVETLSVLKMTTDGSVGLTPFQVVTPSGGSGDYAYFSGVIPDGQGGALVSWYIPGGTSSNPSPSYHITDVSSSGTSDQTYPAFGQPVEEMVLGDAGSGLAYAADGRSVVAFNISGGSPVWTYTPTWTTGSTNILIATAGGGVAINDFQVGVIQLDSAGQPGSPTASLLGATPLELGLSSFCSPLSTPQCGLWANYSGGQTSFSASLFLAPEPSSWIAPDSDQTHNRSAAPIPSNITLSMGPETFYNGQPVYDIATNAVIFPVFYGYQRIATYTVVDASGNGIKNALQLKATEVVNFVASNPPPKPGSTRVATKPSALNSLGQFRDQLTFGFPVPPVPSPGEFVKNKQWISLQTKAQSYPNLRINCVDQEYNDETVTDVTSNPNATCQ